jgi:putative acetyltransferase
MAAWAPVDRDPYALTAWAAARAAAHTTVAVQDDEVVGFSDLVHGDLLDMLYVDPRAGGRGIGSALIRQTVSVARARGVAVIETYASLTARPVFERNGFAVIERRTPVVRGVAMTNFKMHRIL